MTTHLSRGMLITIEGIDGSGKSTAAKALAQALEKHYEVVLTKEPGSTAIGQTLRSFLQTRTDYVYPLTEYLLFAADRAQHIYEKVKPALSDRKIVISDRMADSSVAYQGYGRGLDISMIQAVNEWAMQEIKPDLTIYLKIDYKTARERLNKRNEQQTAFEREQEEFFKRIAYGFDEIFKKNSCVITLDATLPQVQLHDLLIESVFGYLVKQNYEKPYEMSL